MSKARGCLEETLRVQGQEQQLRGATPRPRAGEAAERSYRTSEVSGGWEETPASEVRGGWEKPSLARGQGWQLGGATRGAMAVRA